MSIALFFIIGVKICAGTWYWVLFCIFSFLKVANFGILVGKKLKEVDE